jgi:hypothetical protein
MIGNELLKTAQTYLNPCLVKLFNAVFTSGIYPQIWSEGYITPIFKSENPKLPQNYRGIIICNSIGKVFNSILNNRLDKFLIENNIIHENQIGFPKKSRTSDHIFVLKCIIEKYLKTDTKSYLCALWTSIKHLILLFIPALDINSLEMVSMDYSIG